MHCVHYVYNLIKWKLFGTSYYDIIYEFILSFVSCQFIFLHFSWAQYISKEIASNTIYFSILVTTAYTHNIQIMRSYVWENVCAMMFQTITKPPRRHNETQRNIHSQINTSTNSNVYCRVGSVYWYLLIISLLLNLKFY